MSKSENDLRSLNDEKLAMLSKNGNHDAFSVLVGRYVFTVRNRASSYSGSGIDFEDLVQEGTIGLMYAVNAFEPEIGTGFYTLARLCIDRKIISAVRSTFRKKQIPQSSLVFLDDFDSHNLSKDSNPESVIIEREDLELLYKKIFSKLTDLELEVLKLYLSGYTYEGIASALECSVKSVDNALQRLRRKLNS